MNRIATRIAGLAAVVVVAACAATAAFAGTIYEEKGIAIKGYDAVAYFTQGRPVRGLAKFKVKHEGATFLFATAANRDSFAKNPTRWAPAYGGFCAYGTSQGYKAAIDPAAFTLVEGRLYLNYNAEVKKMWSEDIPGFIGKADRNWPDVAKTSKVHR